MSGILTSLFKKFASNAFIQRFSGSDNLYFFISNIEPWTNDLTPPVPADTVRSTNFDFWRNIYALKKIGPANISFAANRNDWTANTVYAPYRDNDATLATEAFFVLTSDFNVYKCISNHNGAPSTVKPTGTSTSSITLADGYVWKYMFSVGASGAVTFLTANYIPVQTLTSNDGSLQWAVQAAATPGSIEFVEILNGGSGFVGDVGSVQAGTINSVTLQTNVAVNNGLVGYSVYIKSGTGAGQLRNITSWTANTKIASLDANWTTIPDLSSTYEVGPKVSVAGDGNTFLAYGSVTTNSVSSINILNRGTGYTHANAVVTANNGVGANVYPHISPRGGHGSNPVEELYSENVIISVTTNGSEGGTISTGNDFRVVGVLANPVLTNGSPATDAVYDQTEKLALTSIVGTFSGDEVVTGQTSLATGQVVDFNTPTVRLVNVMGTFANGEIIIGATSAARGTINGVTLQPLSLFKGDLLSIENRVAVARSTTQAEDFRVIISF